MYEVYSQTFGRHIFIIDRSVINLLINRYFLTIIWQLNFETDSFTYYYFRQKLMVLENLIKTKKKSSSILIFLL